EFPDLYSTTEKQAQTQLDGRGFTREDRIAKPDLAAPGVDIISCAPGGGYALRTGTSKATPFVTGSAALLMQWGILEGNDPFLYGEKLKAYLINGTRPLHGITEYPSREIGWGVLCVNDSIP
ncbi:MAG: S8 family serine peptidase, partial [Agathobacter sp.]|nr:S8 family serine peptidase [Agathobacter sp.]